MPSRATLQVSAGAKNETWPATISARVISGPPGPQPWSKGRSSASTPSKSQRKVRHDPPGDASGGRSRGAATTGRRGAASLRNTGTFMGLRRAVSSTVGRVVSCSVGAGWKVHRARPSANTANTASLHFIAPPTMR